MVNTNASLDQEYRKVASYKPLVDSYKTQITELEAKTASRGKEVEGLKWELEKAKEELKVSRIISRSGIG